MGKITEVNEQAVVNFYLQPNSIKTTCKQFHIGETRLRNILKKYDIQTRKPGEHSKIYTVNKDFFLQQSAELGYFLGLLASDGCVGSNDNVIYIELQEQDAEILEQLRKIIQLKRPIKFYTTKRGYKSAKLYFEDKEIKKIISSKYHIVPRKTYDLEHFIFPKEELSKKYWKDYIRGYFDGDGSVKITGNSLTFQIDSSSYNILNHIKKYLFEETGIKLKIATQYPSLNNNRTIPLYRLYGYGINAEKILDFLYKDSNLFLKRKKDKFLKIRKEK